MPQSEADYARRHKFRKLKDRVAATDVSVARKLLSEHELELDGSSSSWTLEALETACGTDLTAPFTEFWREVEPYVHSLPLILHNLPKLLVAIEDKLMAEDTGETKLTLLRIIPVLAKDVRGELMPYLNQVFDMVTAQVVDTDLTLCAEAFRTLGGILTELDLNLETVRDRMVNLVGHRRDFVRKFAADSFAPVVRRCSPKVLPKQIKLIVCRFAAGSDAPQRDSRQQEEIVDGAAQLLFSTVRNVQRKLHSRAPEVLKAFFKTLFTTDNDEVLEQRAAVTQRFLELAFYYTEKDTAEPIWTALKEVSSKVNSPANTAQYARLVNFALRYKHYRCANHAVAAEILAFLESKEGKPHWDKKGDIHRVDALDEMLKLHFAIGEEHSPPTMLQRILLQYAQVQDLIRLVDSARKFRDAEPSLERLVRDLDNRFEAIEEKDVIVQTTAMVAKPERNWLKLTPNGIINYCLENLEDHAAMTTTQLAAPGKANNAIVKQLVKFVISIDPETANEKSDMRNFAIDILSSTADWSRNQGPRRELLSVLLDKLEHIILEPASLLTLANLVELEELELPEEQKESVLKKHRNQLIENLMHPSHRIRLGAAKLLRDLSPPQDFVSKEDDQPDLDLGRCDVLDKMAHMEELPVTFENDRYRQQDVLDLERYVRLGRVPENLYAPISAFYLGQFFVKYSPCWKWVTKAMTSFAEDAERFHEICWPLFWKHIQYLVRTDADLEFEKDDDPTKNFGTTTTMQVFQSTLQAMIPIAPKVESHAETLVPLFFRFLRDEYYTAPGRDDLDQPNANEAENGFLAALRTPPPEVATNSSRKVSSTKLVSWLEVLSSFRKFRPHARTEVMRIIFERFLLKTETKVQQLCLEGLKHMRLPCLHGHQETLEKLIKEDTFRDTITIFKITDIDPAQRPELLPILYRLLFARLLIRKRSINMNNRRAAIFSFFTGVDEKKEIEPLFDILFRVFPFLPKKGIAEDPEAAMETLHLTDVAVERLSGFVNTLKQVLRQLGHLCVPFFDRILCVLFGLIKYGLGPLEDPRIKPLRLEALKRLTQIFRDFPDEPLGEHWIPSFSKYLAPAFETLPETMINAHDIPNTLAMVYAISSSPTHLEWAVRKASPQIVPQVIRCLGEGVKDNRLPSFNVSNVVYDILDKFVGLTDLIDEHIPLILDVLYLRLERRFLSSRALKILTEVAPLVKTTHKDQCSRLVELLSNFLFFANASRTSMSYADFNSEQGELNVSMLIGRVRPREEVGQDRRASLLATIASLMKVVPSKTHAEKLAPLFGVLRIDPLYDIETRRELVNVYSSLEVPEELLGLNAFDRRRVGLQDFDQRLTAYESLEKNSIIHPAVVHHALFDLIEDEYPLRSAAANYLTKVVVHSQNQHILKSIVFPSLRASLKLTNALARKSVMQVLGYAIRNVENLDRYEEMRALMNPDDLENDFFHSIVHVQTHRQGEALKSLRLKMSAGEIKLSDESMIDIILPLTMHIVLESSQTKYDTMHGEDVEMLQEMARHLSWTYYSALLRNLLGLIRMNQANEKRLLRASCSIIDVFHFDALNDVAVRSVMQSQVLRSLERHLGNDNNVRIYVAIAIVKVLHRLPEEAMALNLPRLLRKICEVMRSINLDARNESRNTLVAVALELGPSHLSNIITTMTDTLNEGYKLHIRGYSLNALLTGVESMLRGNIDELLPKIVSVIEEEMFGSLSLQKRSDTEYKSRVKKLMESRTNKSFDTVELTARYIEFLPAESIHILLRPFLQRIDISTDLKELRAVEEGLRRVQVGISRNESVQVNQLLVYVHHLLSLQGKKSLRTLGEKANTSEDMEEEDDNIKRKVNLSSWLVNESRSAQRKSLLRTKAYEGIHIVEEAPKLTGRDRFDVVRSRKMTATKKANRHIVVDHALDLLLGAFRVKRLEQDNSEHQSMLDPFVDQLTELSTAAAASRTTVLSLRVLSQCLPWELPSMREHIGEITENVLTLLQRIGFSTNAQGGGSAQSVGGHASSTASDATLESIRMMTLVLRQCDYYELSKDHLKLLVLLAQHNMSILPRQHTTLALLRTIVDRELVVPEVYDLMKTLSEMVFVAGNTQVRTLCTRILVTFFVHYPLTTKRLRQHLDLLVANLDFEVESGRQSGLMMLRAILDKFPTEVLDEVASFLFFSLVQRLVNEDSGECRALVADVIKRLFTEISAKSVSTLLDLVLTWLKQSDDEGEMLLKRAAIQLVGLVAESSVGKSMKVKDARVYYDLLVEILSQERSSSESKGWQEAFADAAEDDSEHWLTPYYALLSLHKLCFNIRGLGVEAARKLYDDGTLSAFYDNHPHRWVKLAGLRMLGQVLDASKPDSFEVQEVFTMAQAQVRLVNDDSLDEQTSDQLTKNLVWAISIFTSDAEGYAEQLEWIIRRLSFTARYKGGKDDHKLADLRQLVAFRLFALAATQLGAKVEPYLVTMVQPLARVEDQPKIHGSNFEAPALAKDVLELLEQLVGSQIYLRAYTTVQESISKARLERKTARMTERVNDPVEYQRKRQIKTKSNRDAKKRKISMHKRREGR